MRDAYCSYKLAGLLQNAGFDFSSSGKLVNSRGEILPSEILGFAQACDGTEESTATLQSVRSWLADRNIKIEIHYSIHKDIHTATIIRRQDHGTTIRELNDREFKDYDDCLENAIIYVLECYFSE